MSHWMLFMVGASIHALCPAYAGHYGLTHHGMFTFTADLCYVRQVRPLPPVRSA
jgi:hypothetical protein